MNDALRSAAEAYAIAAHNELRRSYEAAGMNPPPDSYRPYPSPVLLRAAVAAFLRAWEPSEEARQAAMGGAKNISLRDLLRNAARAEAERIETERGG